MVKSLREYREERYETIAEFVAFLEVAADTLYRIQRGERPRISTMRKIADKLGVHPGDIEEFVPKSHHRQSARMDT
jgi:transcriptional regulator with XRE-family HTH domain